MTDFYEPWQPAIGQRVRFRISPECPLQHKWHGVSGAGDGMAIVKERVEKCPAGHGYRIWHEDHHAMVWAAAVELEPA